MEAVFFIIVIVGFLLFVYWSNRDFTPFDKLAKKLKRKRPSPRSPREMAITESSERQIVDEVMGKKEPAEQEMRQTHIDFLIANIKDTDGEINGPIFSELRRRAKKEPSLIPQIADLFANLAFYSSENGKVYFDNDTVRIIGNWGQQAKSAVPKLVTLLSLRATPAPGLYQDPEVTQWIERSISLLKSDVRDALKKIDTPEALANERAVASGNGIDSLSPETVNMIVRATALDNMNPSKADEIVGLGSEGIPALIYVFENARQLGKSRGIACDQGMLAALILSRARKGNEAAQAFIRKIAQNQVQLYDFGGQRAFTLAQEFVKGEK